MSEARTICWFSAGAASAVSTKIVLKERGPNTWVVYCETKSEHPDNRRFIADCEDWFGQSVIRIRSTEYTDTWDVWERERFLSGPKGAPCTRELKFIPRLNFQLPSDMHVFGYTADRLDVNRANRMLEEYPMLKQRHPLIEQGLTKANVLAIVQGAGIELPVMYRLGFHNNNCIPCVKATSPAYWALVRKCFPDEFDRMASLSRELGVRLAILGQEKVNGKRANIRAFIDEIPADQPVTNPVAPFCDFLCQIAEQDMDEAA